MRRSTISIRSPNFYHIQSFCCLLSVEEGEEETACKYVDYYRTRFASRVKGRSSTRSRQRSRRVREVRVNLVQRSPLAFLVPTGFMVHDQGYYERDRLATTSGISPHLRTLFYNSASGGPGHAAPPRFIIDARFIFSHPSPLFPRRAAAVGVALSRPDVRS